MALFEKTSEAKTVRKETDRSKPGKAHRKK
jgi:hypothetical protein